MATPSLAMIPSAYADSKVYSVLPNNGDGDFTFNRDSSATRVGQNGLIQTVGYFGSELVTNGDFSNGTTSWSAQYSATISVVNGQLKITASSTGGGRCSQGITTIIGKNYLLKATITNGNSSGVTIKISNTSNLDSAYFNSASNASINPAEVMHTFTATSTTTYIGTNQGGSANNTAFLDNVSVVEVTGDQPRLNYDISNGVVQSCPSLLLEPASTNLIIQSNQFNTSWAATAVTLQDNQSGVSGGLNAWKITEDTSTSQHFVQLASSLTAATEQTVTIYAKAAERNYLMLNQSGVFRTYYDLVNGTVVSSGTGVTASMESMPNGWWRCIYTATMTYTSLRVCVNDDGSSNSYTGDGVSGIYIQYCQNETLSYATSYIPTNGSSQTRAAETCFGAGTSSTFNSTEGVLFLDIEITENSTEVKQTALCNGTTSEAVKILQLSGSTDFRFEVVMSSGTNFQENLTLNPYQRNKCALQYKANDYKVFVNGVKQTVTQRSTVPVNLDRFNFNRGVSSADNFYGNIRDVRVYNEALTDIKLQKLTTL